MSVKMMNDKTITGTNSTGRGTYMPLVKRDDATRCSGIFMACYLPRKTLYLLLITYDAMMALRAVSVNKE